MRVKLRDYRLGILLSGASLALTSPIHAQVTAPIEGEKPPTDEIIVTAQRRAERLEEVPASVSVITADSLAAAGVVRFQDLGNSVVGVQIARTGAFTQPSIRGVSTLLSGTGLDNNIGVYIDGFYQPDTFSINADLANIQGVEVLKGPQGALYGRNATGGAILISTKTPSTRLEGQIGASVANFDEQSVNGYLSGPLSSMLSASVAGYFRKNDGYIRDIAGFDTAPFKTWAVRTKVQFKPADWATFTLGYNHLYLNDGRGLTYTVFAQFPAGYVGTSDRDKTSVDRQTTNLVESDEVTLTSIFKTGIGDLSLYTGYKDSNYTLNYDFDGQKRVLLALTGDNGQRTFQQGANLQVTVIDRFNLVAGGLYLIDKVSQRANNSYTGGALVSSSNLTLHTNAISFYADGTLNLDRLHITAGGRYSGETKEVDFRTTIGNLANSLNGPRKKTYNRFTPRMNVRYEIADRTNLYASYSQGFKSGTYPTSATAVALALPIKEETVFGYEVGVKSASRRWRWNAAAYYYDYKNLQVSTTQTVGATVAQVLGNAKAARIYGVEAEFTGHVTDRLEISAGAAYNHARYTNIANATGTGLNPITGLNVTTIQDWSGKTMVRSPAWTANFQATYTLPLLGGTTEVTGAVSYSSSFIPNNPSTFATSIAPVNTNTAQRWFTNGYTLVNVQAAWTAPGDHLTITPYVNNLTDKRYAIVLNGASFGSYRQFNEPRTYGVRAAYKF